MLVIHLTSAISGSWFMRDASGYLWLGAVLNSDGTFASDIALWPVTFQVVTR